MNFEIFRKDRDSRRNEHVEKMLEAIKRPIAISKAVVILTTAKTVMVTTDLKLRKLSTE